ncbi:MAG TPA: ABC transporter substrate-binding protein [Stellaceae bacterium]|jgi:NitT/TauT family transport system substrate-binding protein|nr:ABC transporter substrate-binding protein [Stellaceae bacterium]
MLERVIGFCGLAAALRAAPAPAADKRGCIRQAILVLCVVLGAATPAQALDKVRAGKAIGSLWAFLALDLGVEQGLFAKNGVEVEISDLGSGPKLQQGLASDSIDVGLSAGSDMAFSVKGSPALTVAAFAEEPRSVVIMVDADSPLQKPADFKDRLVAMPGVGSVSEWLLRRMAVAEGFGKDGIRMVAQGSVQANLAALRTHDIDGMIGPLEIGFNLEDRHEGRIAVRLAQYAPHFHAHIIFARTEFIADHADVLTRFLKGFFAAIRVMKTDKAATSDLAVRVLHESPSIADRTYDAEAGMLIDDGQFDPQAIALLKQSWVELGMLDKEPSDDQILTTRFVPVKP